MRCFGWSWGRWLSFARPTARDRPAGCFKQQAKREGTMETGHVYTYAEAGAFCLGGITTLVLGGISNTIAAGIAGAISGACFGLFF